MLQENIVLVQVGPRHGGDSGWQEEEHFHSDFANAVKVNGHGYNWFPL